ncbi:outer membrane lipoprotein carrier protein LolA [Dokdonia sinensis]|uniref:Outer membrane lipoprotein carrier protein LolA n=2 Tax=Dokdonia sinensis TaxID=2479847 RepID=A0A3M0FYE2_9FLAO|nr:outer membrane lipoprotein carrier protein LolA [Dokdonia sinensis]RMB57654.1 outer membrane lipoprotein carrier protein LolA [Dokdonia sinensis]
MKKKLIFWLAPILFRRVLVPVARKGYHSFVKRTMPVVVLLFMAAFAKAQSAQTLLKEVDAKVKSYENIAIDFKYGLSNDAEGINQETRGNVVLQGDLYKLDLIGTTQLFDGKNVYSISPEDEEVTISPMSDQDPDAITPSKMLSFFNDGYRQEMDISQNVQGRTIQFVKLTPIDSNSEIKSTLLGIDKQTKHIYKLIISQKNGSKITITVNSFKTNQPMAKNMFVFDESKYSNYYINKL